MDGWNLEVPKDELSSAQEGFWKLDSNWHIPSKRLTCLDGLWSTVSDMYFFITLNLIRNRAIIALDSNCSRHRLKNHLYRLAIIVCFEMTYVIEKEMKSRVSCVDDEDCESCRLAYCWWTAAKFDECAKLKLDYTDVSILSFRLLR